MRHWTWSWAATLLLVAPALNCGAMQDDAGADLTTVNAALESTGLPNGTVCGLAYRRPDLPIQGTNFCEGFQTITFRTYSNDLCAVDGPFDTIGSGFKKVADGDRGLPVCNGFYHRRFDNLNSVDSRFFRLPRGTACGFKEACNNSGETCMGFDANVSCPAGWLKKVASDIKAPSGCGFVWCEYQDPANLCTTQACRVTNQPEGLICGITDNDRNNGQCLGMQTVQGCPSGYVRAGYFDDGRSVGHGVGWCARGVIIQ